MANGHGGARPGAGHPTNEFNEWLSEFKKTHPPERVLEMYWEVASGAPMEQVVTDAGESISTPAAIRDRLKAGELYLDRTIGKVPQVTEITGANGSEFSAIPTAALREIVDALRSGPTRSSGSRTGEKA